MTGGFSVGVLGTYSKTKETSRQLRDLVERARAERTDREPTTTKLRTPKELHGDVQQAIVERYQSGTSMKELARDLGVHRTTVRVVLDRHGVPPRDQRVISPEQVATASRLYLSGLSLAAVGEKLGFNAQTIATHLRRAGVSLRDPHGRVR